MAEKVRGEPDMEGTKDILEGKWHELKGKGQAAMGKLTDDDLTRLSGKSEELAVSCRNDTDRQKNKRKAKSTIGCIRMTKSTEIHETRRFAPLTKRS
jgi:uncharacterized protein YjbJ (UPF0337 family)